MSDETAERHERAPAWAIAALAGAVVLCLPLIAMATAGSEDLERPIAIAGWLICAWIAAIDLSRRAQRHLPLEDGTVVAVAYDTLPMVLLAAPVVAVTAAITAHVLLAIVAAVLCGDLLAMLVPRLRSERVPRWARHAPRLRVAVANVFVDNPTPDAAARQLVRSGADVVVIAEATPDFMRIFDAAGGLARYPHRVLDPDDHSDYAVAVVSRRPLGQRSRMQQVGELNLAIAEVPVGAVTATVVGLNPRATFDPDGHETWKEQIAALEAFVPTVSGPLLVAGDLNGTRFRPEFEGLLDHGLRDCLDAVGQAWTPSFSLGSIRPLGAIGHIARLDHALGNDAVHALRGRNLDACGSDHLPFELTIAVRREPSTEGSRPLSSAAA